MGYRPQRKTYKLKFVDGEYEGLEVRARSAPLGQFMDITEMAGLAKGDSANLSADDLEKVTGMYRSFADCLVEWNVEDEVGGVVVPVPATLEGLLAQDMTFVNELIKAWMRAVAGVARPKETPSSDGVPSLVASIPTETLSPSLAS